MTFKTLGIVAILQLLIITSCKKGDTGPAGTSNVIYSEWRNSSPWVASTTSTGSGKQTFYFDIAESEITQEILDNGNLYVYAKFVNDPDGPGLVKQLPYTYYNLGSAATQYNFQQAMSLGKVRIICDVAPFGTPSNNNQLRYVIVPGGRPVSGRGIEQIPYVELCKMYNIPE